jgi:pyridoxal 5'-phosphate synthase pdxS subunit
MTDVLTGTFKLKTGLAEMLKGGVIMDVTNAEQARIAEDAGAVAVMALERVPSDIRRDGGVARMSDPAIVEAIMQTVSIPVMAKCRIGHFAEARVLEALGVDYIDESEVLTPADEEHHINKHNYKVPFVCGCRNLGEALRRVTEGAAMLRTKGEAGTGDVVEAVRHARTVFAEIRRLKAAIFNREKGKPAKGEGTIRAVLKSVANAQDSRCPTGTFDVSSAARSGDFGLWVREERFGRACKSRFTAERVTFGRFMDALGFKILMESFSSRESLRTSSRDRELTAAPIFITVGTTRSLQRSS